MYCTIPVLVVITVYSTDVSTVQYLRNNDIIRVAYQVDTNHFSGIGIIPPPPRLVLSVFIGWYCLVFIGRYFGWYYCVYVAYFSKLAGTFF